MKYLTTTLAGIVLLAFLVFLIPFSVPTSAHESSNGFIIHMNKDEFLPDRIVVKPGNRIIFENTSDTAIWPASNDHPNHTLYDGTSIDEHCDKETSIAFDACTGIAPNESWSFAFERVGIYHYHNHNDSFVEGVIIVRKYPLQNFFKSVLRLTPFKNKSARSQLFSKIEKYKDEKNQYSKIVKKKNPRVAIETLQAESEIDPKINSICHDLLHVIGRTAYKKYGGFEESVIYHQDFCNSGYIHGLFEVYFQTESDPLMEIGTLCQDRNILTRGIDIWQCEHGIGHGLMYFTQGDLDESIRLCQDTLAEESAVNCINGAYMEVFNTEILAHEPEFVDKDDPFATCRLRDTRQNDCFIYTLVYFRGTLGMSFSQIIEECKELDGSHRDSCAIGVGAELMKRNMHAPKEVIEVCTNSDRRRDAQSCINGASSMAINQKASFKAGTDFCDVVPEKYRPSCHLMIKDKKLMFE